ncbi:Flavonol synthase/flavanone 3-hydroxylase [Seminavis robusta]|uniref:Flavonol synthase/flavanone 3-hydroxylase n=1 Tax=Seminavis robusta TaxID=568900 RepID=A0A9N8DEP0_9STRA|nr:Flavonol synthase/flavanone 3-hydroxylase [Seminavis robusta]|eukprot:Sro83_g044230.1 Flavonol synthase/flavanone 3-hydroxylase (393) ;mRNA; f:23724-25016
MSSVASSTTRRGVLPILDLAVWEKNPTVFAEQLRIACHRVGFFLLRHDMPQEVAQRQLDETRRFFQQSTIEEKLSISYHNSPSFRGYMKLGVENTAGATDMREQIEYAALYSPKDRTRMWPPYERLKHHQNPWPHSHQPELQTATEEYVGHARRISDVIRDALCMALGVHRDTLDPFFGRNCTQNGETDNAIEQEPPHWVLKLINYPVVQTENKQDKSPKFGVGGHTDTNFLTLVLQDDVGGLQVFSEGDWIDVPSNLGPGVLVCNLGEQAEILSGGYFLATPHRVLANVGNKRDRVSVALFYNPLLSATIEPIVDPEQFHSPTNNNPDETTATSALKWERSDFEPWRRKSNAMLSTVGDNTFKSLARSHPEVFQKHHPDLKLLEDGSVVQG